MYVFLVKNKALLLPQSVWYDLVSGELVSQGSETLTIAAPLEKIPLFVRGGSILPTQEPALNTVLRWKHILNYKIKLI